MPNPLLATLRVPHFLPLWISNLLQFAATYAQLVALQWLVTSLTDSRTLLGLVGFVQGVVIFATSPLAGVAVDRLAKRRVLAVGRLGLAVVALAVAALVAADRIAIGHLLVAAFAGGLFSSFMQPATQTFVFDVVGRERVQHAVALNSGATGLAQTAGPFAGGALLALAGFVGAYLSAAAGLLLAAALLLRVPVSGRSAAPPAAASWWADLREVLDYVGANPGVKWALVACTMAIFNGSLQAMRPVFARHVLEVGSVGYGSMAGAAGLGGLTTALVLALRPPLRRPGVVVVASMLGFSACCFLYAFAFSYAYILAVEFLSGVFGQIWMVATFSGFQMAVPEAMRGRIVGLVFTLVMLAPVSQLFIGMLADAIGDQLAMGIFGLTPTLALAVLLAASWRSLARM